MKYTLAKIDSIQRNAPIYGAKLGCANFKAVSDALRGDFDAWHAGAGSHVLDARGAVLFHSRHYDLARFVSHGPHVPLSLVVQIANDESP